MSTLDTFLFAVGVFVFMLTVYGAVVAGGMALKQQQLAQLPEGTNEVVKSDGFEIFLTSPEADGVASPN
jgi:hypothetical protein